MSIPDVNVRLNAEQIPPMVGRLAAEGSLRLETILHRQDGSQFPVETSAKHITFGGEELLLAHVRDVSERHRVEAMLRLTEQAVNVLDRLSVANAGMAASSAAIAAPSRVWA